MRKPRTILLYVALIAIVVGIFVGMLVYSYLFPPFFGEITYVAVCLFIVFLAFFDRESVVQWVNFYFFAIGLVFGMVFNQLLALDFIAKPSVISLVVAPLTSAISFISVLWITKWENLIEKSRYIFLGISLVSLMFAGAVFVKIVISYLPLYPLEGPQDVSSILISLLS